jgi:hypothetical protein
MRQRGEQRFVTTPDTELVPALCPAERMGQKRATETIKSRGIRANGSKVYGKFSHTWNLAATRRICGIFHKTLPSWLLSIPSNPDAQLTPQTFLPDYQRDRR